jgi:hypothetical protein
MSHTEIPSLVAQEPSSFEIAVRDRSWDWLLEPRRRLKVDLLLVDEVAAVQFPVLGDQAGRLSGLLEHGDAQLQSAITSSLRERSSRTLDLSGMQIVCVPTKTDRNGCGALVVGRVHPDPQDPGASRAQLELVAAWLSAAVEAHFLSPPAFPSSGLNRVAPLAQLLAQASERESDRELIRLFNEAIAVWHDIEVTGYVETTTGGFARAVTLPGTKKGERPAILASLGMPYTTELTCLPQGHLDRFGLPLSNNVYVRRFKAGRRSWLLVFTGEIGAYDLQRIGAYAALLEIALTLSTTTFTTRVATAISGRLAGGDASPEMQAARALEEMRAAFSAAAASLTIASRPEFSCSPSRARRAASKSRLTPEDSGRCSSKQRNGITLRRFRSGASRAFSSLLETMLLPVRWQRCSTCGPLGLSVSRVCVASGGRRRVISPRCSGVQRVRLSTGDRQWQWSSSSFEILRRCQALQRWIAGIRAQMRAFDLAGMLSEKEIGVLIHDTGAEQARMIAERLRAVVGGRLGHESILVGVAGRNPGHGTVDRIVHDAQADAVAARRGRVSDFPHGVTR